MFCFVAASALVAPARGGDMPAGVAAQGVLEDFLKALAGNDPQRAYALVAPETKEKGDPVAYGARADYESFLGEVQSRPSTKFGAYELGGRQTLGETEFRIVLHFKVGDNDEARLVKVGEQWYVANPIHIIR